jgi:predicted protein tyrosine phosphatase
MLVCQRPSLVSHIQKKYNHAGKSLFEDVNAWAALSEIFKNILRDPNLSRTYLVIDALDECIVGLPKLLNFIVQQSALTARVKWIVSSRNWPDIEEQLDSAGYKVCLSLELNAKSISSAVAIYIQHRVHQLAKRKRYDNETRDAVLYHLSLNADDTFLWVALVCRKLEEFRSWETVDKLGMNAFPPGLDSLYQRMMGQILRSDRADLYKRIIASIATVYRPITLEELSSLVEMPLGLSNNMTSLGEAVTDCGSFLTIREGTIYFVHQSAKDYLCTKEYKEIFPHGQEEIHRTIFSRSLHLMSKTLRRDIYGLCAPGDAIEQIEMPEPDPLSRSRYSCVYWIDHFCQWKSDLLRNGQVELQEEGVVETFIRKKYLYWLEALSLCRGMSEGVLSMAKLETLIQVLWERQSYTIHP